MSQIKRCRADIALSIQHANLLFSRLLGSALDEGLLPTALYPASLHLLNDRLAHRLAHRRHGQLSSKKRM